jgi:hypothetical protein
LESDFKVQSKLRKGKIRSINMLSNSKALVANDEKKKRNKIQMLPRQRSRVKLRKSSKSWLMKMTTVSR